MKVSNTKPNTEVTFRTTNQKAGAIKGAQWWLAKGDKQKCGELLDNAAFLKETQSPRYRQTALYARMYGNMALASFIGQNMSKVEQTSGLPTDRPTFNIISSAADTLISRISQSRPAPTFLTDNSDYRERNLAKKLNNFILGELYQTKGYEKATMALRDALVTGTGCLHIYETDDNKVGVERVLMTELLTDPNESLYGEPRQLYRLKLVDRQVLMERSPKYKQIVKDAEQAYPDNSADSSKTVSDLVMVVEAWHLPSGPDAKDGRHTIACTSGLLVDEEYTKDKFPFVFLQYSQRLLGFWGQGLAEQLMGTQMEINQLLYTISKAIKLVGVPRVFIEAGSKVSKASNNNDVGVIVEYRGTKPIYEVAPCVPQELYAQLQRLIDYGYQQCGVSALQASSQKPAGLNSGEAIRSYDDISTDRFAALARRYDNLFIDLAYAIIDLAKDICERDGEYQTVYPGKNGVKQIDLPNASLLKNPFVIQCFNQNSLPRDPAGRMQKVTEMVQSGMITLQQGRRLLDFPDLSQIETLDNASEERIFQLLDEIVENGTPAQADPFMDLALASEYVVKYYNLYAAAKLEEEKQQMLRDFYSSVQTLKTQAMTPPPGAPGAPGQPPAGGATPQALPETPPTNPLIPNAPQAA